MPSSDEEKKKVKDEKHAFEIDRLDGDSPLSSETVYWGILGEYVYGLLGLLFGFVAILLGVILTIRGVAGEVSWTTSFLGLSSEINDAGPGVVLALIGLFIIYITRPGVRLKSVSADHRGNL